MSNHSNWSSSVGYGQFVLDSYAYFSNHLHQLRTEYRFPQQFFEDFIIVVGNNTDPLLTFTCIVLVAIFLTGLRYAFTKFLIKVQFQSFNRIFCVWICDAKVQWFLT